MFPNFIYIIIPSGTAVPVYRGGNGGTERIHNQCQASTLGQNFRWF